MVACARYHAALRARVGAWKSRDDRFGLTLHSSWGAAATSTIKTVGPLLRSFPSLVSYVHTCPSYNCSVDAEIATLTNLTSLSLSSSYGFNSWPSLSNLTKLQTFSLTCTYGYYPSYGVPYDASLLAGITTLTSVTIYSGPYYYAFSILPDITASTGLVTLKLAGNFTTLPDTFSGFVNLTTIDFSGNPQLKKLPASLASCPKLTYLTCSSCNLSSDDSFFDMSNTKINYISLSSNNIKSVPTSLCTLPTSVPIGTQQVFFDGNALTSFPSCFSQNSKLAYLSMTNTNFSSFPTSILGLTGMSRLSMRYNAQPLVGNFDFSLLTSLVYLDITSAQIVGAFPNSLAGISTLYSITAPGNNFQGTIAPNFFQNLGSFTYLEITGSSVSGAFPAVTNARSLTTLYCGRNRFTSLPDGFQNTTYLAYIDFSDNQLTSIPADSVWKSLTRLRNLWIGGNTELTGLLPTFWAQQANFPNINSVNMSFTGYYGDFPNINSSSLRYAYFSGAGLNGRIQGFTQANGLYELTLDRNALTGTIPNSIGSASTGALYLQRLDLSYNILSGALPVYFTSLTSLTTLVLNNNGFSGAVPNVNLLTGLTTLQIQNNQFELCSANPGIGYRLQGRCNVTNNAFPDACGCGNYYTYCSVNTTCPAPDYVPISTPYTIPVPIKPPTAAPVPVPVFTPALIATPSQSTTPVDDSQEPIGAASPIALSAAVVFCSALLAALIM